MSRKLNAKKVTSKKAATAASSVLRDKRTSKNNVSSELRTGSDGYVDVLKIEADIWGRKLEHNKNTLLAKDVSRM